MYLKQRNYIDYFSTDKLEANYAKLWSWHLSYKWKGYYIILLNYFEFWILKKIKKSNLK